MPLSDNWSHFRAFLLTTLVLFLSACGGGGSDSPVIEDAFSFETYKNDELDFIDKELRRLHPDLFFSLSQSMYETELAVLRNNAENMSDAEFRLEMAKFVAKIGDQHTYVSMPGAYMKHYPVKIWWEGNRAIIIETDQNHTRFLGHELKSIDNTLLWELKDVGMQFLAYQNDAWKNAQSPRFIAMAEMLYYEGVTASPDIATFTFESIDGETEVIELASKQNIRDWVSIESQQSTVPLYKISDDNYHYLVDGDMLYIQYNSAITMGDYSLSGFIGDIQRDLELNEISQIVVDIRFNYGGAIDHFIPVISFLAESGYNDSDSLFVLTGRNSFSSAVGAIYSFQAMTNATFIGGPTGGKPNGFSHVIGYRLPGSLNALYMSTNYLAVTEDEVDSFYPPHQTLFTQQHFLQGSDPALIYIEQNWP